MNSPVTILDKLPFIGNQTANGNTAFAVLVPPDSKGHGKGGNNLFTWDVAQKRGSWEGANNGVGVTTIDKIVYTTGNTGHVVMVLRPLNFTFTTVAAAPNTNSLTLALDPSKFSTNMMYGLIGTPVGRGGSVAAPGSWPLSTSDLTMTLGDYVVLQLSDGTWLLDTVTSFNTTTKVLILATALPAPTVPSGGNTVNAVLVNTPVFYYGPGGGTITTELDPNTGAVQPQTKTILSTNRIDLLPDYQCGTIAALHPGDPLVFYSPNTTAAGILDALLGYYSLP